MEAGRTRYLAAVKLHDLSLGYAHNHEMLVERVYGGILRPKTEGLIAQVRDVETRIKSVRRKAGTMFAHRDPCSIG